MGVHSWQRYRRGSLRCVVYSGRQIRTPYLDPRCSKSTTGQIPGTRMCVSDTTCPSGLILGISLQWIYRGDDWLFVRRWEQLVERRDMIDIVQIISYNGASPFLPACVVRPDYDRECRLRRIALHRSDQRRPARIPCMGGRVPARALAASCRLLRARIQKRGIPGHRDRHDIYVGTTAPQRGYCG